MILNHLWLTCGRLVALLLALTVGSVLQTVARDKSTAAPQENPLSQAQLSTLQEISRADRERRRSRRSTGISVLFAGAEYREGTAAAQVLAKELGRDVYRVDLSKIVSKYIGETEKNLQQVFATAAAHHAILFFDEADALFGKRTEVKDSHDRYANQAINYLLQQIEAYDGITIIAAKRKESIDPAFLRRLRFIIHFRSPSRT
jgi:SpoVK/Ycf46/Vps4 family AAA+-type ATPase